jgi:hypothetical protein
VRRAGQAQEPLAPGRQPSPQLEHPALARRAGPEQLQRERLLPERQLRERLLRARLRLELLERERLRPELLPEAALS